jgi:hypothetical protein
MKKIIYVFLLIVICVALISWLVWVRARYDYQQYMLFLRGTVRSGVMMQATINEYRRQVGRYPTYSEFTNIYNNIDSFRESITPHMTNRVVPVLDNLDGWFYNEKTGEVKINYNGKYTIGFRSWIVDVSKINFSSPTKVEMMQFGKTKILDFSCFNQLAEACLPQTEGIISNWVATNIITTSAANSLIGPISTATPPPTNTTR